MIKKTALRNIDHLMADAKLLFHGSGGGSIDPLNPLLICLLCCNDPLLPRSVLVNVVLELIEALLYVLSSLFSLS